MDKIEYEEWALKAVDPALSPKPWTAIAHGAEGGKQGGADGVGKVSRLGLALSLHCDDSHDA